MSLSVACWQVRVSTLSVLILPNVIIGVPQILSSIQCGGDNIMLIFSLTG